MFSASTLTRAGAMLVLAGVVAACGGGTPAPAPTQPPAVSAPTAAPTAEPAEPTAAPTAEPTAAPTAAPEPTAAPTAEPSSFLFTSASDIPVQFELPAGWTVADFGERADADKVGLPEQSIKALAPDGESSLVVRYYDYKGPGSGDVTGAYMAIQFNEDIDRTTVAETSDDDGNMDAEWTYVDAATSAPTHALLRFVHNEGSSYTYAVLFQAPEEQFAELAPVGKAIIASFQER